MKSALVKLCLEKGILLDREIADVLESFDDSEVREIIENVSRLQGKLVSKSFFVEHASQLKGITSEKYFEKLQIKLGLSIEISREITKKEEKNEEGNVKVLYTSPNLSRKIVVGDFVSYFRSRFSELRRILQERPEMENLNSINKITGDRNNLSVIGMVYEKRITKTKNILISIEDLTGRISVLVNQNKPELYEKARDIIPDSIIGVRGIGSREIVFANDIIFPECKIHEKASFDRDESVAFISDVHVGSKMFLGKNFERFIRWINGEIGDARTREDALKVKYLLVTGDTIDGVGVYPGQEALLNIKDIKDQYKKLAEYLGKIRKDVTMVLCPGQHDGVRVAEPQPAVGSEYGASLHELGNLILVSNPALIEIKNDLGKRGFKIMMYHGASMHPIISEVESLRTIRAHDTPSKIVRHLLKSRHLAPIHSVVTYIPSDKTDDLLIRDVPDVITTADLHRPDVDMYNNILIICNSCWQSITPFEEKVGNHPDPCKVPVLNLKSRQIKILDFSDAEENKECIEEGENISCKVEQKNEENLVPLEEIPSEIKIEVPMEIGEKDVNVMVEKLKSEVKS